MIGPKRMGKSDEYKAIVELEGYGLPIGRNKRIICPRCSGGRTKQTSFVIYYDKHTGDLQGDCKRAACHLFVRPHGSGKTSGGYAREQGGKIFNPKYCYADRFPIISVRMRELHRKYNISLRVVRREKWEYIPTQNRYYFPLYDRFGARFGALTKIRSKRLLREREPKTVLYLEKEGMRMHWPLSVERRPRFKTLVVVEDVISATRVAQIVPCVAMLGTNLTPSQFEEFAKITDKLILAFDNDAYKKACDYRDKWEGLFKDGIQAPLMLQDPKDYKNDIILEEMLNIT